MKLYAFAIALLLVSLSEQAPTQDEAVDFAIARAKEANPGKNVEVASVSQSNPASPKFVVELNMDGKTCRIDLSTDDSGKLRVDINKDSENPCLN